MARWNCRRAGGERVGVQEEASGGDGALRGYEAVRDHFATLQAETKEVGRGLPQYVERDFARYLECGVLAHGFERARCESCQDEIPVAFSCKGEGGRRVEREAGAGDGVTVVHLVERMPYRQWTMSFPHRMR